MIPLIAASLLMGASASEAPRVPSTLVWRAQLPGGHPNSANHAERSRPVLTDEGLLLGSNSGQGLYLLSVVDGRVLNQFPALGSVQSSAVVGDDWIAFSDVAGKTYAYSVGGAPLWEHDSGSPILSTPSVDEDHIYITNVDNLTVAISRADGSLSWQYQRPKDGARVAELALFGAPTPVVSGDAVITGYSDGGLVGLSRATGDKLWDVQLGTGRYPDVVATPTSHNSDIFATGYFGPLQAIDQQTQNVRWTADAGAADAGLVVQSSKGELFMQPGSDGVLRALSVLTGTEVWQWATGKNGALTRPVVMGTAVLIGATDGGLALIDIETGALVWRDRFEFLLEGVSAAPLVSGRDVYFVSNAGFVYRLRIPVDDYANHSVTNDGWTRINR